MNNSLKYFYIKVVDRHHFTDYYFCRMGMVNKFGGCGMEGHASITSKRVTSFPTAEQANTFLKTQILVHRGFLEKDFYIVYNDGETEERVTNLNQ